MSKSILRQVPEARQTLAHSRSCGMASKEPSQPRRGDTSRFNARIRMPSNETLRAACHPSGVFPLGSAWYPPFPRWARIGRPYGAPRVPLGASGGMNRAGPKVPRLLAVMQPPQKAAQDCAEADCRQNEGPRQGDGDPRHDNKPDRDDTPDCGPRHGHVAKGEPLRLRFRSTRCLFEHGLCGAGFTGRGKTPTRSRCHPELTRVFASG